MNNQPILSLCIPTNGALQWLRPVLESIYAQDCDESLFEVLVSDNAKNPELEKYVRDLPHSNIHYQQSDAEGFMNIVSSFQQAHGEFCKLINHRAVLLDGTLQKMLDLVQQNRERKPVIYCTNGKLGDVPETILCKNLDEMVYKLNAYCSWMAGIGIWKQDLKNLDGIEYNQLFPNTTILFEQRQEESEYLLWNETYFHEQTGRGRGCYNLFRTFAVVFPEMFFNLRDRGRITAETCDKVVKKDIRSLFTIFYIEFVLRCPDDSYDMTGIHQSITTYYSEWDYICMMCYCYKCYFNILVVGLLDKLKNLYGKS